MKISTFYFIFIFVLLFFSCDKKETDFIFEKERFDNLKTLHINRAIQSENELGSVERKYDNTFAIGEDYYPNKLKFQLAHPKVFEIEESNLRLETDYFYNKKDGLVKVILYQWNDKSDTLHLESDKKSIFKNKYDEIVKNLEIRLGKGSKVNTLPHSHSFQYAYEWKTENLNVYLSMYDYYNSFGEIRMIVYHE